jgi:hypothetical protein
LASSWAAWWAKWAALRSADGPENGSGRLSPARERAPVPCPPPPRARSSRRPPDTSARNSRSVCTTVRPCRPAAQGRALLRQRLRAPAARHALPGMVKHGGSASAAERGQAGDRCPPSSSPHTAKHLTTTPPVGTHPQRLLDGLGVALADGAPQLNHAAHALHAGLDARVARVRLRAGARGPRRGGGGGQQAGGWTCYNKDLPRPGALRLLTPSPPASQVPAPMHPPQRRHPLQASHLLLGREVTPVHAGGCVCRQALAQVLVHGLGQEGGEGGHDLRGGGRGRRGGEGGHALHATPKQQAWHRVSAPTNLRCSWPSLAGAALGVHVALHCHNASCWVAGRHAATACQRSAAAAGRPRPPC